MMIMMCTCRYFAIGFSFAYALFLHIQQELKVYLIKSKHRKTFINGRKINMLEEKWKACRRSDSNLEQEDVGEMDRLMEHEAALRREMCVPVTQTSTHLITLSHAQVQLL